ISFGDRFRHDSPKGRAPGTAAEVGDERRTDRRGRAGVFVLGRAGPAPRPVVPAAPGPRLWPGVDVGPAGWFGSDSRPSPVGSQDAGLQAAFAGGDGLSRGAGTGWLARRTGFLTFDGASHEPKAPATASPGPRWRHGPTHSPPSRGQPPY